MADPKPVPSAAARRAELIRATLERRGSRTGRTGKGAPAPPAPSATIPRRPGAGPAPLSFSQERLWFLERLEETAGGYNLTLPLRLDGELQPALLGCALDGVVRRHESLRTHFEERDGAPVQVVDRPLCGLLRRADLSRLPPARREEVFHRTSRELATRPFDLSRGPLVRAVLLSLGPARHAFVLTIHHIVCDGWSTGVLLRELGALYRAAVHGEPSPLPELPLQYADFAVWQRRWLTGEVLAERLAHWRELLEGAPEELALPFDRPRPPVQTYRGGSHAIRLEGSLAATLAGLAQREGGTLFMVLLAGWAALLSRYAGQGDLTVGVPVASRNRLELEPLIGFFANTLVLRADLRDRPTFTEAVRRLKEVSLGAYAHQELPFEKLVEELRPSRSLSHSPLFQVLFALQNVGAASLSLPGVEVTRLPLGAAAARFDLELTLMEKDGALEGRLVYNRDLFDPDTAGRMSRHLGNLLESAVAEPDRPVAELALLDPAERRQLLREWGRSEAVPLAAETLCAAFEAQADRAPEAPAAGGGGISYTYRELDCSASRIARFLRGLGVGPEAPVAVLLGRTADLPAVLLGVHKAGGAYVPLDPTHPPERLELILESARPAALVTERAHAGRVPGWRGPVLEIDAQRAELEALSPERLPREIGGRSLAYVIFTSGSTGRPKGVQVPHRALMSFLASMAREPGLGRDDVLVAVTTAGFDIAALELFLPLVVGARVVVADRETVADASLLAALLAAEGATVLQATPVTWQMLLASGWEGDPGLVALCGGEAMPPDLAAALRPRVAALWNLYGPTETTVWSTVFRVEGDTPADGHGGAVAIGRPIADTAVQVLDPDLEPVPVGTAGELWIGGAGVARGYLGQPGLTAERFVPAPRPGETGERPGGRAYRTGDLVRFRSVGVLQFLARMDHQVKVRGFRVELGEIEAALAGRPEVAQAVVVAREERPGDLRLVAYVVPRGDAVDGGELREGLRATLPDYMLPSAYVALDELPLTPSGKVDRRALPVPEWASEAERVAPRDEVDRQLARIWSELLGVPYERLGLADDFFALGGHSLLATRMISRLRTAFGVEVSLRRVLEAPTLAGVKGAVVAAAGGLPVGDDGARAQGRVDTGPSGTARIAPLSFAQERLWFLDRMGVTPGGYNVISVLRLDGDLDGVALSRALTEVARRHEPLRTRLELVDGRPSQVIEPEPRVDLGRVDLRRIGVGTAGGGAEGEALRLTEVLSRYPFDLSRAPLLRAALLRVGERARTVVLLVHHVISDGWSMDVLQRELAALYGAFAAGRPSPLPELSYRYADYAAWQREWLGGGELERQLSYWRRRLDGMPEELELPTDRPRPPVQTHRGGVASLSVSPARSRELESLARAEGGTLFMALAAGFSSLLGRYGGQCEFGLGTPIANRTRLETEPLIGLFVNTLVLRCDLAGDPSFRELVRRTRECALEAYAHQDLPFEKLVAELRPRRDLSRSPLFQVLLSLQNVPTSAPRFPGLDARPIGAATAAARFDLELVLRLHDGTLRGHLIYNRDLFDAATARRMARHVSRHLEGAAADPETAISRLPLLGPSERQQVLHEVNDTAAPTWGDTPLHRWFEAQAARTPDRVALCFGDARLSYGELRRRAAGLARHLRRHGVGSEMRVGIAAERSLELVVALLAVLEAGGAYVPLDPSYPTERLAFMLADSDLRCLLVQGRLLPRFPEVPTGVAVVDLDARPAPSAGSPPKEGAGPDAAAYVIYTSGSTGRPKGAANSHRAIVNRLVWMQRAFRLGADDRVLQKTPASFDVSVWEFFWPLMAGACLVVARPDGHRDSAYLAGTVERERITTLHFVPSMLQVFLGERDLSGCAGVRRVIVSGEALPRDLAVRFFERFPEPAELHNLYGPTEAAVDVTWWPCERGAARRTVPIGRPIAHVTIQLADSRLRPVPFGVSGEILIGGGNLARGYLGRPALTAERFIPDPFGRPRGAGGRLYRTGDLARRLPGGEVEFLGRLDHQVKVRGVRIELGEIESRLLEHPSVREAVVVSRRDARGGARLVAYTTPAAAGAGPVDLRDHLRRILPDAMVPADFVVLQELPRNPSGKVDRRALPEPDGARRPAGSAPRSALERAVAAVWCEVLGRDRVGVEDNFFDLGGHSLLLVEVQRRLEEVLDRDLEIVDLFRYPTVRALAGAFAGVAPEALASRSGSLEGRLRAAGVEVPGRVGSGGIAVVGMVARVPGAADLEAFWDLLESGREGIRSLTDEELRASGVTEEEWTAPGYVRARGVLEAADAFDAAFFGYSPREVQIMDPQQRVFLEAAWEAVEHAGYDSRRTRGRVGVFAGAGMNTYLFNLLAHPEVIDTVGPYQVAIANKHDTLPTRVSYQLDLTGPSVNVQTACSTSLVAVHLACRSLLEGECDLALAGGVSVSGTPTAGYRHQPGGIASPDGHCRAFDAEARGTVAGEGVGVVVLKRLADALVDGDTVHAIVRGTAINNDGSVKAGFTAPGVAGQAEAIASALEEAEVDPATVGYVEAHGTGTELGDPIEVTALTQAFRARSRGGLRAGRCAIGSVKTNVGHLDAAAGVVGLIKTVLALGHRRIPPSLHFRRPNPKIDLGATPFAVNARSRNWSAEEGPLRAGVSSFGIGGTNAHAVLEEAPPRSPSGPSRPWQLLVLSARSRSALEEASARLADHLRRRPDQPLADVAYTLQMGRRPWELRHALVCRNAGEAADLLEGSEPRRLIVGRCDPGSPPGVAFLFPGQGAQHAGMAAEVYAHERTFRETLDRCADALAPELGLDLRRALFPKAGTGDGGAAADLRETAIAQPALFAVEYALARLWQSWGVEPEAMLGHSLGEYVAACLAGVFSLEDALGLVAARGRLMQAMPPGAMLAASVGEEEVQVLLKESAGALSLAAVNGPEAVVVSGPTEAVEALHSRLAARGAVVRRLHTSHAFHSAAMDPVLEPFAERLRRVVLQAPRIPFVSNLTGTWITNGEATDPDYWTRQLRETVRFADGLTRLLGGPARALLEVGPGRTLATLARQHPARGSAREIAYSLPHPRAQDSDEPFLLSTLGRLWAAGVEVDWDGFQRGETRHRVPLPTYPFQRRRFWVPRAPATRQPVAVAGRAVEVLLAEAADARSEQAGVARPPGAPPYVAPGSDLERTIAGLWQETLGTGPVGVHDEFFDLGGSSLLAVRVEARLRERLGVELDPHVLLEAPTVFALAARLAAAGTPVGREEAEGPSLLVEVQPGDPTVPPLFLVHPAGGHVYRFRDLGRALAEAGFAGRVLALRASGLAEGEEPLATVEEMADRYLEEVHRVQPAGPFHVAGSSMGGMVAYEMARRLRGDGRAVGLVALLDTFGPGQMPEGLAEGEPAEAAGEGGDDPGPSRAEDQAASAARRVRRIAAAATRAMLGYRPPHAPGRIVFLRAAERRPGDPGHPELAWIGVPAGGTAVHVVPGDHDTLHEPPHVTAVAAVLAGYLTDREVTAEAVGPLPGAGPDRNRSGTSSREANAGRRRVVRP